MNTSSTPQEPKDLSAHTRLREEVFNLINQVWIEGKRDKDGINKYVDRVLELCGGEAKKVLPPECAESMDHLFLANKA